MSKFQPRQDTLPLEEISVRQVEADANPFSGFNPEGVICRRAAELGRGIVDAQNRMTAERGSEYMRAAYESFSLSLEHKLLTRFAREAGRALRDLTAVDAISKTVIVLQTEIEQPGGDAKEKQEQLAALEQIEQLFRAEYADLTTGALPDSSAD